MNTKQKLNVCKKCGYILDDDHKEDNSCPLCKNPKLTTFWQGYVMMVDPEKSEVAKILNIENRGKFALRIS
jgi:DNA-directed RNA polymerase subunit E"